jgi:hypothetical protein
MSRLPTGCRTCGCLLGSWESRKIGVCSPCQRGGFYFVIHPRRHGGRRVRLVDTRGIPPEEILQRLAKHEIDTGEVRQALESRCHGVGGVTAFQVVDQLMEWLKAGMEADKR